MSNGENKYNEISKITIELAIKLILLIILLVFCIAIILPFLNPFLWGTIIAIAITPLYKRICSWVGGRKKLIVQIICLSHSSHFSSRHS